MVLILKYLDENKLTYIIDDDKLTKINEYSYL
jgi:hypothetical protein